MYGRYFRGTIRTCDQERETLRDSGACDRGFGRAFRRLYGAHRRPNRLGADLLLREPLYGRAPPCPRSLALLDWGVRPTDGRAGYPELAVAATPEGVPTPAGDKGRQRRPRRAGAARRRWRHW